MQPCTGGYTVAVMTIRTPGVRKNRVKTIHEGTRLGRRISDQEKKAEKTLHEGRLPQNSTSTPVGPLWAPEVGLTKDGLHWLVLQVVLGPTRTLRAVRAWIIEVC
jgi:hypothetical protein